MEQQPPPAGPPPSPPAQPPPVQPPPTPERGKLPAWQIALWVVLLALIVFLTRPDEELSAYQIGRWAGGIVLPLLLGAGLWALAGRRGAQKADMRSPAVVALALPIALLGALADSSDGDAGGGLREGAPATAELVERFVSVPELAYARLPAEAEAEVARNLEAFNEFAETHELRMLVGPDGRERARVLALGFDAAAMGDGDEGDFLAGAADSMASSSGNPTEQVTVGGVNGVLGEAQGTSILLLPDIEDGVALYVYASQDSRALEIGEHLVSSF